MVMYFGGGRKVTRAIVIEAGAIVYPAVVVIF